MSESKRITYADAAAYLGIKVGTLRSMVARKQVPHIRLGGKLVRFDVAELDAWIKQHSVPVND